MEIFQTTEEFNTQINSKKVNMIYGAGWAGNVVSMYMRSRNIPIEAFMVTEQGQNWKLGEIPVYCLHDVLTQYQKEDLNIILAIGMLYRVRMERELDKRNIDDYYEISEFLQYDMLREMMALDAEKIESIEVQKDDRYQKTVGYLSWKYIGADYPLKRLIIDKIENVSYVEIPWEAAENNYGISQNVKQVIEACYCPDKYIPQVDLIHMMNAVCETDKTWCASFETTIPRVWPETNNEKEYYQHLVELMKRPNCKALYPLCKNAYEIAKHNLTSYVTLDDVEALIKKMKVLHPPQKVLITEEEFDKKHHSQKIHFVFVGSNFFRKGGREIIEILSEFEEKYRFKLTIISSLVYNDFFTHTSREEMLRIRKIIQEKEWIDYEESLPNEEVLEKCKEATIGLLPSVADTYGFAVLEMQAAGCPVVTTNIRAFPEINNESCGWICEIPIDEFGYCMETDQSIWSEILRKKLRQCFQDIFSNPLRVKEKGRNALERIKRIHDPYKYQEELKKNLL